MKKAFLLALASVITLGSFANHNHKVAKHAKKANTTVCPCPPTCPCKPTCQKATCAHI